MLIQKPRIPVKDIVLYGFLPSFLKIWVYRLKGYHIGRRVSLGFGSVICGNKVSVGEFTCIGLFSIVRGKEISIGEHVSIGSFTFLDTPYLEIGDGSKINEQVFVGGLQFPDSRLVLGRNCQIMQMTFINPAPSVTMGDDSGIGGHCLVFGHNSWLSKFEGYPVEFKPIEIGENVSVSWGAFLLPGSKIGDGAVIGASSVVSRTIPPKCLALGFPARVISKVPDFPREVSEPEKEEMLKEIVDEMIAVFQKCGLACTGGHNGFEISTFERRRWRRRKRRWKLAVQYSNRQDNDAPVDDDGIDVLLSLKTIPPDLRKRLFRKQVMWIDIEKKEQSNFSNDLGDEVVLFLRRYGVRFFRVKN
jgi:acetyltransferase-like isoleucine patch superfamily enzyme